MTDQPRTPAGNPNGGQFAEGSGAEAAITLAPTAAPTDGVTVQDTTDIDNGYARTVVRKVGANLYVVTENLFDVNDEPEEDDNFEVSVQRSHLLCTDPGNIDATLIHRDTEDFYVSGGYPTFDDALTAARGHADNTEGVLDWSGDYRDSMGDLIFDRKIIGLVDTMLDAQDAERINTDRFTDPNADHEGHGCCIRCGGTGKQVWSPSAPGGPSWVTLCHDHSQTSDTVVASITEALTGGFTPTPRRPRGSATK